MELLPVSHYAHELKSALPAGALAPDSRTLAWLPAHLAIITVATVAIAMRWVPWPVAVVGSLVIGVSFAGLTFVGHEALHRAVVRSRWLSHVVGFFGFLPFAVSPRLWIVWHNHIHHPNANHPGVDPDANPTLAEYLANRRIRVITDHFALGRRSLTGWLSFLIGFSVQSLHMLVVARRRGYLTRREHLLAIGETVLGVALWSALALLVGPLPFLFAYVLPLAVANAIVLAFIVTNHGLSPLTPINDPLVNSLSVTVPRVVDWITLRFGLHVEHHLFPSMASSRLPALRELVRARWPERYQSLPLVTALARLHRTARVYKDDTTLVDPRSGRQWPTLLPGSADFQLPHHQIHARANQPARPTGAATDGGADPSASSR